MNACPNNAENLPSYIRVSVGSAVVLDLLDGKLDAVSKTVYLMTYKSGKCTANCSFCPQARDSLSSSELLSRVTWPRFSIESVLKKIEAATVKGEIKRVCIQALNYPQVFENLAAIVRAIKLRVDVPISISCQPIDRADIAKLCEAGANRIAIPLDASTKKLFNKVKGSVVDGPYDWVHQLKKLKEAVALFGEGNVSTHLIVGLGETEKDLLRTIQRIVDMHVLPALFAFTPVRGTALEDKCPPVVESYRRVQLGRYLIVWGFAQFRDMSFDVEGRVMNFGVKIALLKKIVETGKPFLTSGCPDCSRPFYNEKPSGPIFNYPRQISKEEIGIITQELGLDLPINNLT